MTKEEIVKKELDVFEWMNKQGYDRRASKDVAPIIVKYLDSLQPVDKIKNVCNYYISGMDTAMNCINCGKPKYQHFNYGNNTKI